MAVKRLLPAAFAAFAFQTFAPQQSSRLGTRSQMNHFTSHLKKMATLDAQTMANLKTRFSFEMVHGI
ncbi:hypothetical protein HDU98_000778 [Podochytrium sp. JEL0797]|nr:hypothetical protein HDU98_000778 [Podochytrium sp. JEL0797]